MERVVECWEVRKGRKQQMEELRNFIARELVILEYGCEYIGIKEDISLAQLYQLRGLVEAIITENLPTDQ